jgi:regulator of protease activity HflC (stomatin/prohibitin superfamily)
VKGPGFVVINPLTTRAYKVDLREKQKLQESDTISKPDNTKIKIQTRWAYRIMDPVKAVSVPNIDLALEGMLTISLRDLVQNKPLASIQNEQIQIEADLRTRMNDSIGERWGVKILQTELVKISKVTLEID